MEQREMAAEIGVSAATYGGWETNRRRPNLRHVPAVIRFLGFDWREPDPSLGDRIRHARTAVGLSIRELAETLTTDPATVRGWEVGLHTPSPKSLARIDHWLLHGPARRMA
jgi:DNA-binding transcriptional regulator YiaG